jgi:hypothetical protein
MRKQGLVGVVALCVAASAVLGACKSNNIDDTTNNYVTQVVGPSGGLVTGPGGATVNIPANALTESVSIEVTQLQSASYPTGMPSMPSGWSVKGYAFSLQPHGQAFDLPVAITVPYAGATPSEVALVTASPSGTWSTVTSAVISDTSAQVNSPHFSYYAVVTGAPAVLVDAGHDSGSTGDGGDTPSLTIQGDRKIRIVDDAGIGYGSADSGVYTTYENLPAALIGTVGNYTLNLSADVSFTLSGATTCYLIRNNYWTTVDMTGWNDFDTSNGGYFVYESDPGTIYSKTLGPGTYQLNTFSAMYACKAQ